MSRLPQSTEYQAVNLLMKDLLSSDNLSTEDKFLLNSEIEAVSITHEISERTLRDVTAGSTIERFFVLNVELKTAKVNDKAIKLLDSCINQNLLFKLIHSSMAKLAIVTDSLVQNEFADISELAEDDDIFPELRGSDIDTIWANLIADIGHYELEASETEDKSFLFEQLHQNEQCAKLEKEVTRLEKKCFAEKQPRRKVELYEKLQAKKDDLAALKAKLSHHDL